MKSLIVVISIHHNNTVKIAKAFAEVLGAQIIAPREADPEKISEYDLVGFGSGIYDEKHHRALLELVEKLPLVTNKMAFIFSTSGVSRGYKEFHSSLREKLQSKGYVIVDEFNCVGFNTNSFLRYFGGMNKGRPNADDIKRAEEFAQNMIMEETA